MEALALPLPLRTKRDAAAAGGGGGGGSAVTILTPLEEGEAEVGEREALERGEGTANPSLPPKLPLSSSSSSSFSSPLPPPLKLVEVVGDVRAPDTPPLFPFPEAWDKAVGGKSTLPPLAALAAAEEVTVAPSPMAPLLPMLVGGGRLGEEARVVVAVAVAVEAEVETPLAAAAAAATGGRSEGRVGGMATMWCVLPLTVGGDGGAAAAAAGDDEVPAASLRLAGVVGGEDKVR